MGVQQELAREARAARPERDKPTQRSRSRTLTYLLINTTVSATRGSLIVDAFEQRIQGHGENEKPGKLRRVDLSLATLQGLIDRPEEPDEEPFPVIAALPEEDSKQPAPQRGRRGKRGKKRANTSGNPNGFRRFQLPASLFDEVLPGLCEDGILRQWDGRRPGHPEPLVWDTETTWRFVLHLEFAAGGRMRLRGMLERGEEEVPLTTALLFLPHASEEEALVVFEDRISVLAVENRADLAWIKMLRDAGEVVFPEEELAEAVATLLEMPGLPHLEAPEGLELKKADAELQPRLVLEKEDTPEFMNPQLMAELFFTYGELEVGADDLRPRGGRLGKGHLCTPGPRQGAGGTSSPARGGPATGYRPG